MDSNTFLVVLVFVLTVLFLGLGIVLILIYQRNKKKAVASMAWPETRGTIVSSRVVEGESSFSSDDDGGSQPMYSAEVTYTYQVDGVLYTFDRVSFAGKSSYSNPKKAEEQTAKFPEGSQVAVFYNPEKSDEAVLERSAKGSGIFLGMGIGFIAVAVITLVVGLVLFL